MDLEKKPLSSLSVISSNPAERRRATRVRIHSSAPSAVFALPARQMTPRQSPVSARKARRG